MTEQVLHADHIWVMEGGEEEGEGGVMLLEMGGRGHGFAPVLLNYVSPERTGLMCYEVCFHFRFKKNEKF